MERTVGIARGTSRFANPAHLRNNAVRLFQDLKDEDHLQGLDAPTFAKRSAHYVVELNALHPFRDGNGRTMREFLRQLAVQGNHQISPAVLLRERWIEACIHGFNQDATLMGRLIAEALTAPVPERAAECLSLRTLDEKKRGYWLRRIRASSLPDDVKADYLAKLR